jgi:hypothetical protein
MPIQFFEAPPVIAANYELLEQLPTTDSDTPSQTKAHVGAKQPRSRVQANPDDLPETKRRLFGA